MMNNIKRSVNRAIISTIATFILGIVLVIAPGTSISIITACIAVLVMILGVLLIIDYFKTEKEAQVLSISLIIGLVLLGIGIFLFIRRDALVNFITIIIGLSLLFKGLYKLQISLNVRSISSAWKYSFVVGILTLVLAFVLIMYPNGTAELFLRIMGILLIIGSVIDLGETMYIGKSIKDIKDEVKKEAKEINFVEK